MCGCRRQLELGRHTVVLSVTPPPKGWNLRLLIPAREPESILKYLIV